MKGFKQFVKDTAFNLLLLFWVALAFFWVMEQVNINF
jgi:hypothetical protein